MDKIKLHALIKLISYVKFECEEYESKEFAGSPIIGELLKDLLEQYSDPEFKVTLDNPFTTTLIKAIKLRLKQTQYWESMNEELKLLYIQDLAAPYILDADLLKDLKNYNDT